MGALLLHQYTLLYSKTFRKINYSCCRSRINFGRQKRAEKLKEILKSKDIQQIFSTKTVRTLNTALPLAELINKEVKIYDAKNQNQFIEELKSSKNNTLVVGHSNTIRYIINGLSEKEVLSKDLEDSEYNFLFHVKINKKGRSKIAINHF